jgi:hypothetical protein
MSLIGELDTAQNRRISPRLNAPESAAFSVRSIDAIAPFISPVDTCLLCYRNGVRRWSGPVWTLDETLPDGNVNVTCTGWFSELNGRILKTGTSAPAASPTTTATSHSYVNIDQVSIATDLVNRTNADASTHLVIGAAPSTMPSGARIVTYQQYQNIGQAIVQLSQIENGFDFHVDYTLRTLDMFYGNVKAGTTIFGRGQDRPNAHFGYAFGPSNITNLKRTVDGSKLVNQLIVQGAYASGIASDAGSISRYGTWQANEQLSDVVSTTILGAYAQGEVFARSVPQVIYTFDQLPRGMGEAFFDPFDDFDIGDFAYISSNYGRMVLQKQPVRIFAFDIAIDAEGNESCTNFQTTFQGSA